MKKLTLALLPLFLVSLIVGCAAQSQTPATPSQTSAVNIQKAPAVIPPDYLDLPKLPSGYTVHDFTRPLPPVVTPAGPVVIPPPPDAIVLFAGKDLNQWKGEKNQPANWKLAESYMEANKTGGISTKQAFGSCQLHVEWASPEKVVGESQGRGNSGIFLMSTYEMQILDSFNNTTYPDGQAAAIYGQTPPLVNASLPPGAWQSYDIVFHRPIFENGKVVRPARVTILHNGVLVQDNTEILGATMHRRLAKYTPHADKMPITLQDHNNPTRFRNIWLRELKD